MTIKYGGMLLAAAALAMTTVPLSGVGAATGNGVDQINAQGTLTATAPAMLAMEFPAGATATGSLHRTWVQGIGTYANFTANQKVNVLANYASPVLSVTATAGRMATPWKQNFAVYVAVSGNTPTQTTTSQQLAGEPNRYRTFDFDFKSEPMKFPTGQTTEIIAGDYRATIDYRIDARNAE
ncbi:hypothetical protein [Lacticaseibacillus suihuaensis]